MKNYMTKNEFDVWVKNSVDSFKKRNDHGKFTNIVSFILNKNSEHPYTTIMNIKNNKTASVKFNETDISLFDNDVGIAIAWAKYRNRPVPKLVRTFSPIYSLKYGDKFYMNNSKYIYIGNYRDKVVYADDLTETVLVDAFSKEFTVALI